MDETMLLKLTMDKLIIVRRVANNGEILTSNQGQAMDGFSELANYREIIDKYIKESERSD